MKKKLMILVLVCAGIIFAACSCKSEQVAESPVEDQSETVEEVVKAPVLPNLGEKLELLELQNVSAPFVEDGSDEMLPSVCRAVFRNATQETIQYAKLSLEINGESYEFTLTTIPAEAVVFAYEIGRKVLPEQWNEVSGSVSQFAVFPEELTMRTDVLSFTGLDGGISVKNNSEEALASGFYVYYKNMTDDAYEGGITYRAAIPALGAGEVYNAYASHYTVADSRLMFVDYAG